MRKKSSPRYFVIPSVTRHFPARHAAAECNLGFQPDTSRRLPSLPFSHSGKMPVRRDRQDACVTWPSRLKIAQTATTFMHSLTSDERFARPSKVGRFLASLGMTIG